MDMSGIVALLGAILASRVINERAYRKLDSEQKLRLMDGFSKIRAYSMIPLLLLIGAFWLISTRTEFPKQELAIGYFALLVLYIIARLILNQRTLMRLDMPEDYQRQFAVAQVVSCIGVAWFFFAIFYG